MFSKLFSAALLLGVAGVGAAFAGPVTIADSTGGFSDTQGANGWTYGYYYGSDTPNPSTFTTAGLVYGSTTSSGWSLGAFPPFLDFEGGSFVHAAHYVPGDFTLPDGVYGPLVNVRRFTYGGASMAADISGNIYKSFNTNGAVDVNAYIYIDGSQVYSTNVAANTDSTSPITYDFTAHLNPGDTVDFVLANPKGDSFGGTVFSATINSIVQTPEPSSAVIALSGLGLVGIWGRRKKS